MVLLSCVQSRRLQLIAAFTKVVTDELECLVGDPPEQYVPHVDRILENTVVRTQRVIRSSAGDDDSIGRGKSILEGIPAFKRMVNADVRRRRAQHYCNGCCVGLDGATSGEGQVKNYVAAFVSMGFFGDVSVAAKPNKGRWRSMTAWLACITAGSLCHGLLDRAWKIAFGWDLPARADDFAKMVRSKARRF